MGRMSADALKNDLSNAARVCLWEVLIPNPGEGDPETFLLRAQSSSVPERAVGQIVIPFKQTAGIAIPGKLVYPHTWDVVFIEGEDREIFKSFYDWCDKVVHAKYGVGSVSATKVDIYLHLLDTDGSVSQKVRMIGCYPQRLSDAALDMATDDILRFTVTFSYDRWERLD